MTLVNHLEEKCVQVTQRVTEVSEQIEKVEANGEDHSPYIPSLMFIHFLFSLSSEGSSEAE